MPELANIVRVIQIRMCYKEKKVMKIKLIKASLFLRLEEITVWKFLDKNAQCINSVPGVISVFYNTKCKS